MARLSSLPGLRELDNNVNNATFLFDAAAHYAHHAFHVYCASDVVSAATKSQCECAVLVRTIKRKLEADLLPLQQHACIRGAQYHEQPVKLLIRYPTIRIVSLRSLLVGGYCRRQPEEPAAKL